MTFRIRKRKEEKLKEQEQKMKEKQEKLKEDEQRNSIADISVGYGLNYTAYLYIKNKNQHLKLSTAFQIFRRLIFCSFVIVSASL